MLKKTLLGIFFAFTALLSPMSAYAADDNKSNEAINLVKKAAAYLKENGTDKSFSAFNDPKGEFVKNEFYIFVINQQGKMVSHGNLPKIIGKDVIDMKDADGKYLFKEMLAATNSKNSAWVNYKWPNPSTKRLGDKSTYLERVGEYVIGCGFYKDTM